MRPVKLSSQGLLCTSPTPLHTAVVIVSVLLASSLLMSCGDEDDGAQETSAGSLGGACREQSPYCNTGLVCDWRDEICARDCQSTDRACFSPFVCQLGQETGGYHCDLESVPDCRGTPAGQAVPFQTTDGDIPIHWPLGDSCIPVSYDAEVADVADRIQLAHEAWSAVSCSRVCFDEPRQDLDEPDTYRAERRVHWTSTALRPGASPSFAIQFSVATGALISAEVVLPPEAGSRANVTLQQFIALVGRMSGLDQPSSSTADSVLSSSATGQTQLGADDEAALCVLYGTPAYCE